MDQIIKNSLTILGETERVGECRLPCSLSPLSPGRPRPRPWVESEAGWALARREVEDRRERIRREELSLVETARRPWEGESHKRIIMKPRRESEAQGDRRKGKL